MTRWFELPHHFNVISLFSSIYSPSTSTFTLEIISHRVSHSSAFAANGVYLYSLYLEFKRSKLYPVYNQIDFSGKEIRISLEFSSSKTLDFPRFYLTYFSFLRIKSSNPLFSLQVYSKLLQL